MRTRSLRNIAGSVIFAGLSLISVSSIMAQTPNPGGDTPTGVAGGFGGSMPIGSGTFDFYEMNATRSVTDCTVRGAVIPFSYTRIWNSRSHGWTDNWQWSCKANTDLESDNFLGYTIYYPDGRVVQFNKPVKNGAPGDPGVYPPNLGVVDRFSVVASPQEGQLLTSDGSVVHFPLDGSGSVAGLYGFPMPSPVGGPGGRGIYASSIVDPHGLTVTFTYNSLGRTITEPGGRWIRIGPIQGSPTTHASAILTTSLGQSVTYTFDYHVSGSYTAGAPAPDPGATADPYGPTILTSESSVIYNDVIDPTTGQPVQAHYTYKYVQPFPPGGNQPWGYPFDRLVWAADPMFAGPMQQVRYMYLDNSTLSISRDEIWEERYATSLSDAGIMVNHIDPEPWTYDPTTGYSQSYWKRDHTRGDGCKRTISYFDADDGFGLQLVYSVTDFSGIASHFEKRNYDVTHYFQTPIKITDMNQHVTLQALENVCGHITQVTHPDGYHRDWAYTSVQNPYYVDHMIDEHAQETPTLDHTTQFIRDPTTHRVTQINYPTTSSTAGLYPQTSYETFSYTPLGQVKTHQLTSGGTESFAYYPRNAGAKANELQSWTNADGKTTLYDYDSLGRLSTVTDPRGAYLGDPNYSTTYQYNGRNQVTWTTLPKDRLTGQRYTIQNAYNAQTGTLTSTMDELGHTTSYTYDEYKRVTSVTNPLGETTTTKYDPWNGSSRLSLTTNTPTQVVSPMGKKVYTYYDANLRKSAVQQAPGTTDAAWTWFDYDNVGNLTKVTDGRGASLGDPNHTTVYGYDNRNRKTSQTDPVPFNNQVTTWLYDACNNMKKETRPDTKYRTLGYDERNHLIDTYGFTGEHTHYERDPAGNIGQETMPNGGVYKYTYDYLNRKKTCTCPADWQNIVRSESWLYDAAGNMYQYTNPAGQVKTLLYDNRNRAYHSSWSANSGPTTDTVYDAASRMTSITTNNGETLVSFGYDDANRQTWEEQTVSGGPTTRVNTPRDSDGNRSGLNIPSGPALLYDYTQRNQLWHIKDSGGAAWFTYTYDPAGNMTKRQDNIGGVNDSVNVTPDNMNRVSVWENTGAGDVSFAVSRYTYDNLSRERLVTRDEEPGQGDYFDFNDRNQLTNARYDAALPTPTPAPVISVQPSDRTVTAGQTAAFSVTATGAAPLSYQWKKNSNNISGATAASYTTPATTLADNGAFVVRSGK